MQLGHPRPDGRAAGVAGKILEETVVEAAGNLRPAEFPCALRDLNVQESADDIAHDHAAGFGGEQMLERALAGTDETEVRVAHVQVEVALDAGMVNARAEGFGASEPRGWKRRIGGVVEREHDEFEARELAEEVRVMDADKLLVVSARGGEVGFAFVELREPGEIKQRGDAGLVRGVFRPQRREQPARLVDVGVGFGLRIEQHDAATQAGFADFGELGEGLRGAIERELRPLQPGGFQRVRRRRRGMAGRPGQRQQQQSGGGAPAAKQGRNRAGPRENHEPRARRRRSARD